MDILELDVEVSPGGNRCLPPPADRPPPPGGCGTNPPPETCGTTGWDTGLGGGPLERILFLTIPTLGTRWAVAGGVLVPRRLHTGTTMALLPFFLARTLTLLAEAPKESPGE